MLELSSKGRDFKVAGQLQQTLRVGDCTIEPHGGTVHSPGGPKHVHPKAMRVLLFLIEQAGQVTEREQILRRVWGDSEVSSDTLSHCISELRHALGDHSDAPTYIETLPRRGYRLVAPVGETNRNEPSPQVAPDAPGLWAELRRRKVVRTAAAYMAFSWLLLQVIDTLIPPLPEQVRTIVIGLAVVGLPIVLALAWAYDVSIVSDNRDTFARQLSDFLTRNVNRLLLTGSAVIALVAMTILLQPKQGFSFAAGNAIVLSFQNKTEDESLGSALGEAFRIALEQSPYARVTSRARVDEALTRMGKTADDAVSHDIAIEIAIREGIAAVVAGTVARVGDSYLILAEIINPSNRETIYSTSSTADSNGLLQSLQEVAVKVREKLGESLESVEETNSPLERVSTPNLDALMAFTEAMERKHRYRIPESIDLMREAIKLDPEFAFAHAQLGALLYGSSPAKEMAFEHWTKALSFEDRLTQREKLHIEALLALHSKPDEVLRRWSLLTNLYPNYPIGYAYSGRTYWYFKNDFASGALSYGNAAARGGTWVSDYQRAYCMLGQGEFNEALAGFRTAHQRAGHYYNYGLADAYTASHQHQLARELLAPVIDNRPTSQTADAYEKVVAYYVDRGEFGAAERALNHHAEFLGKKASASEKLDESMVRLALTRHGKDESAYLDMLEATIAPMATRFADARSNDALPPVAEAAFLGKLAARSGKIGAANGLLQLLTNEAAIEGFPIWEAFAKTVRAEMLIAQGQHSAAIGLLAEALEHSNLFQVHESLATAYEASGQLSKAKTEFEWLIAHRGQVFAEYLPNFFGREHSILDWALAHHRLGRVLEQQGRRREATKHYKTLIAHWESADASLRPRQLTQQRLAVLAE